MPLFLILEGSWRGLKVKFCFCVHQSAYNPINCLLLVGQSSHIPFEYMCVYIAVKSIPSSSPTISRRNGALKVCTWTCRTVNTGFTPLHFSSLLDLLPLESPASGRTCSSKLFPTNWNNCQCIFVTRLRHCDLGHDFLYQEFDWYMWCYTGRDGEFEQIPVFEACQIMSARPRFEWKAGFLHDVSCFLQLQLQVDIFQTINSFMVLFAAVACCRKTTTLTKALGILELLQPAS